MAYAMTDAERLTVYNLDNAAILMRQSKPGDRSELDHNYAIVMTELKKLIALYKGLILDKESEND